MPQIDLTTLPIADALRDLQSDRRTLQLSQILGDAAELHIVGGAIRDAFFELPKQDLDYSTRLVPEEIIRRLEKSQLTVIPTGKQFLTITAIVNPELPPVQISTFRGPAVSPDSGACFSQSIEEDIAYRDFTINSFALPITGTRLICAEHAIEDINQRIVRAIGNAEERFREDPLRLLRMVRFATASKFTIDEQTFRAAAKLAPSLSSVSTERIRDEFSKILTADRPDLGLNLLVQLPLLQHFIPELLSCVDFEQNAFHTADVFTHTLAVVRATSPQLTLRLAALFHDIAKPLTLSVDPTTGERHFYCHEVGGADLCENILTRLKYPSQLVRDVVTLVRTHMRPIEAGAGGLRRLIRDTGELFPLWRELKSCDTLACKVDSAHFADRLSRFDEQIAEVKRGPELSPLSSLAVDGHDLLAFGMKEGPEVGITLRALHELVLDNPQLNDKETLLKLVRDGAMTRPAS